MRADSRARARARARARSRAIVQEAEAEAEEVEEQEEEEEEDRRHRADRFANDLTLLGSIETRRPLICEPTLVAKYRYSTR